MKNTVLVCGFKGTNNSSKLLLDNLKVQNKIYFENDFIRSVKQLIKVIKKNNYDLIIMFGQKPVIKSLYLETTGINENEVLMSGYDFENIQRYFIELGYKVKISNNAGKYLCNNIYFHCLKYIKANNIKTEAIFIHLPTISNTFDLKKFAYDLIEYVKRSDLK